MPILSLPTTPGQIVYLCAALAGFAAFVLTLLSVQISVTLAEAAAEQPVERKVTPARRASVASARRANAA
jgi:hypothetical protein